MSYNWQQTDWPHFVYDLPLIEDDLFVFAEETGHITGLLKALPEDVQLSTIIATMVSEAIKTSKIEGESLNEHDVISSIQYKLGFSKTARPIKDKKAEGAAELMVDVRNTYQDRLTKEKLFDWHKMLLKQSKGILIGAWRKSKKPMQVISGTIGREKVHFEAPPSNLVEDEMNKFIEWFNDTAPGEKYEIKKAPVRAAIAHLYFESIHPFEDGNGRIGRAIAEKALSQTLRRRIVLSLSRTIDADKKSYYTALQNAQQKNEITKWLQYFVKTLCLAQQETRQTIDFTIKKIRFLDLFKNTLNERQLKVVLKMIEAGPEGFKGGMTAQKYISITKTSKATATRDLQLLAELNVLLLSGGGRSTHYLLNW